MFHRDAEKGFFFFFFKSGDQDFLFKKFSLGECFQ